MSGMGCPTNTLLWCISWRARRHTSFTLVLLRLLAAIHSYLPVSFSERLEKLVKFNPGLQGLEVLRAEESRGEKTKQIAQGEFADMQTCFSCSPLFLLPLVFMQKIKMSCLDIKPVCVTRKKENVHSCQVFQSLSLFCSSLLKSVSL